MTAAPLARRVDAPRSLLHTFASLAPASALQRLLNAGKCLSGRIEGRGDGRNGRTPQAPFVSFHGGFNSARGNAPSAGLIGEVSTGAVK